MAFRSPIELVLYTTAVLACGGIVGFGVGDTRHKPDINFVPTTIGMAGVAVPDTVTTCHYPAQPTDSDECSIGVTGTVEQRFGLSPAPTDPGTQGYEYRGKWEWMPSINRWMAFDGREFQFSPEIPPDGDDQL